MDGSFPMPSKPEPTPLRSVLNTSEFRSLLAKVLSEILAAYSGSHPLKRLVSRIVSAHVTKSLLRSDGRFHDRDLAALISDPGFADPFFKSVSGALGKLLRLVESAFASIENLPENKRKEIIENLIPSDAAGHAANLMTVLFRILNKIHESDPEFFSKRLAPAVAAEISSLDFAELKDAVEKSEQDICAFVEIVSSIIWEYPTKIVLLLSLIPNLINISSKSLDTILSGFNRLPPDLLADCLISFIGEIDGAAISRVINEVSELVRKFNAGSGLIGDSGAPAFQRAANLLAREIVFNIDPVVFEKAWAGLSVLRQTARSAFQYAADERPDLRKAAWNSRLKQWNLRIDALNNGLESLYNLDDDTLVNDLADIICRAELQELADAANLFLSLFNRICEQRPSFLIDLSERFFDFIDTDELAAAADNFFTGAAPAAQRAARAVLPKIVIRICEVLSPKDDEHEEMAARARAALAGLMVKDWSD